MRIYNAPSIIAGLLVLIGLLTFPFWYNAGDVVAAPEPSLDTPVLQGLQDKQCIEPTPYMRSKHMELLRHWRDEVVRKGKAIYVASDGREYEMSLQGTCLDCHSNTDQFCGRCHDYAGVEPGCWTCHLQPEENVP